MESLQVWINKKIKNIDWSSLQTIERNKEDFEKHDDPKLFLKMNSDKQNILINWCLIALKPTKLFDKSHSSYGLKHLFEHSPLGFYVSNGEFKGAMLVAGFNVQDESQLNWCFNISPKSNLEYWR